MGALLKTSVNVMTMQQPADSQKTSEFDCLTSSRVLAHAEVTGDRENVVVVSYFQYHTPSAVTTMKRYNMKRLNLDIQSAPLRTVKIECANKGEAGKLEKKILNYIERIGPTIERASLGYASKRVDVTEKMTKMVENRNVGSSRAAIKGMEVVMAQKEAFANDKKEKRAPTLTVTYSSKLGRRTKQWEQYENLGELEM